MGEMFENELQILLQALELCFGTKTPFHSKIPTYYRKLKNQNQ